LSSALLLRGRHRDERGAFIVIWALVIVALLVMVAIVIDLGALRQDRRLDRLASDAGAAAGARGLANDAASRMAACATAWDFTVRNLGYDAASNPSSCPSGWTSPTNDCNPLDLAGTTKINVTKAVGDYVITIVNPVLTTDTLMNADSPGGDITQETTSDFNGTPCLRLGVRILSTRHNAFGGIIGSRTSTADVHSVGLRTQSIHTVPANLVILEPFGCPALQAGGTGSIEISNSTTATPGGIAVLSEGKAGDNTKPGACTTTGYTLDVGTGSNNSHITVTAASGPSGDPGQIALNAMTGATCAQPACDPTQYSSATGYYPYPNPPDPDAHVDRTLVDYKYNCITTSNYTGGGRAVPASNYTTAYRYRSVYTQFQQATDPVIGPCTQTQSADYVNKLVRAVDPDFTQTTSTLVTYPTSTYITVPTSGGGSGNCDYSGVAGWPNVTGNVKFNCDPTNDTFNVNGNAWFAYGSKPYGGGDATINGNAVFDTNVSISTGDRLIVNGSAMFSGNVSVTGGTFSILGAPSGTLCTPSSMWLSDATCFARSQAGAFSLAYFRSSDATARTVTMNGGTITLGNTLVFGTKNVQFSLSGGGSIIWNAPGTALSGSPLPGGPFTSLAMWSDWESSGSSGSWMTLKGGGTLQFKGVYFAPRAWWDIGGTSDVTPQFAQFWASVFTNNGTPTFKMTPDDSFIPVPIGAGSRLIR
jgi:Flp pilus assembly protein TadG